MSFCHNPQVLDWFYNSGYLQWREYPGRGRMCNTQHVQEKNTKPQFTKRFLFVAFQCFHSLALERVCLARHLPYTAVKIPEAARCWTHSLSQVQISFAPIYKVPENFLVSYKITFKEKKIFKRICKPHSKTPACRDNLKLTECLGFQILKSTVFFSDIKLTFYSFTKNNILLQSESNQFSHFL